MALIPKFLGSVNFGMEATAGTGVAENATSTLSFTEGSFTDTPVMGKFEGVGAGLTTEDSYMLGRDVGYSLAGHVYLDDIGYVCAHAFGGYGFATATHTWSGADYTDTTRENNLQPWSVILSQGSMGETTGHHFRVQGATCSTFEITGTEREALSYKVDGNAFNVSEYGTVATADLPAENPLEFGMGVFQLGLGTETPDVAIYPTEMTVSVAHNSQTLRNMTTGTEKYDTGAILSGKREVTASIKIPFDNVNGDDIWDLLGGGEGGGTSPNAAGGYVSFDATWTVGSEVFAITIPKAKITNSPWDTNDGSTDPFYITLELESFSSDPTFALTDTAVEDAYHETAV
jgi:hypothetical protein